MNFKKNGKVFTSKFVGTGPSSNEKRIYRVAVSQRLRNTAVDVLTRPKRASELCIMMRRKVRQTATQNQTETNYESQT